VVVWVGEYVNGDGVGLGAYRCVLGSIVY